MYWRDVYAQHEQQVDRQRHADERRLAAAHCNGRGPLYHAGLAWLGRRMVSLGQHLDAHYGASREVCDELQHA